MRKAINLISFCSCLLYNAQTKDSISTQNPKLSEFNNSQKKFFQNPWVKRSVAPSILFVASAATWNQRESIREYRNRYLPNFKVPYDDYLQYAPAVTVYGLKLAGVKGRNNIGRATLSYATSLAIMGILVNTIKYTAKVERPDASKNNSFPSGHTAMAFTNATFLHKEYGLVNPAYSIAGYSAATFTGLGRSFNNRHWLPDILTGAGIGILSTELGYFFINKFYKNDGDNIGILSYIQGNENPSFLALKSGASFATTNFLKQSGLSQKKTVGFEGGLEGAYFFSTSWGVGGEFSFNTFPVRSVKLPTDDPDLQNLNIATESIGLLNVSVGPYFAHDITKDLQLRLKANVGYSKAATGKIFAEFDDMDESPTQQKLHLASYIPSNALRIGTGLDLTYKFCDELGITAYADYYRTSSKITYKFEEPVLDEIEMAQELNNASAQENISYLSLGLKLTAYF